MSTRETTITLDERHYKAAAEKARKLGTTPQAYVQSLIDAADVTFDELLAPVRDAFSKSGTDEDELDQIVTKARKAIHSKSRRKTGK